MKSVINKRKYLVLFIVLVGMMILGSLYDLQISKNLFNLNHKFGLFLAAYGQLPAALSLSVSGFLLIYTRNSKSILSVVLSIFFGIILSGFGLLLTFFEPSMYYPNLNKIVIGVVSVMIVVFANYVVLKIVEDTPSAKIRKFAYFLIAFTFTQFTVINYIKIPWGRPRMRLLAENSEIIFQNWWNIDVSIRNKFVELGIKSEEFKSFPSGHTASAINILVITLLPYVNEKLYKKENYLWYASIVFAFAVAFSRIIMGAHFLTDVTMGFSIGTIIFLVLHAVFYKNKI